MDIFDDEVEGVQVRFTRMKYLEQIASNSSNLKNYVLVGTYLAQSEPGVDWIKIDNRNDVPEGTEAYSAGKIEKYGDRIFLPISFLRKRGIRRRN